MKFSDYKTLRINGRRLEGEEIIDFCRKSTQENIRLLGTFMTDWMDEKQSIQVKTSGSTGKPKTITIAKQDMLQSAARTIAYFGLEKNQTALLCLPMNYIAGKMMVVRAMLGALNLYCVRPSNNPIEQLSDNIKIDFAPLVPMQLDEIDDVKGIKKILLGGSPVNTNLEKKLQNFPAKIYHGYGMTETLSHVAVRKVNGQNRSLTYTALSGITFSVDDRNCLCIHAPFLMHDVQTNDVIQWIDEHTFIWKGRVDFVVNSGGIKISPEEIERKIASFISDSFFLAGIADDKLGEKLVLVIEGEEYDRKKSGALFEKIAATVTKYEKPRAVFFVDAFERTGSGKIKRKETIRKIVHR